MNTTPKYDRKVYSTEGRRFTKFYFSSKEKRSLEECLARRGLKRKRKAMGGCRRAAGWT